MLKEDVRVGYLYRWHAGHSPTRHEADQPMIPDRALVNVVSISDEPGRKFPIAVTYTNENGGKSKEVVAPQELSELN